MKHGCNFRSDHDLEDSYDEFEDLVAHPFELAEPLEETLSRAGSRRGDVWLFCHDCERFFQEKHLRLGRHSFVAGRREQCPFCFSEGFDSDIVIWDWGKETDGNWPTCDGDLRYGLRLKRERIVWEHPSRRWGLREKVDGQLCLQVICDDRNQVLLPLSRFQRRSVKKGNFAHIERIADRLMKDPEAYGSRAIFLGEDIEQDIRYLARANAWERCEDNPPTPGW